MKKFKTIIQIITIVIIFICLINSKAYAATQEFTSKNANDLEEQIQKYLEEFGYDGRNIKDISKTVTAVMGAKKNFNADDWETSEKTYKAQISENLGAKCSAKVTIEEKVKTSNPGNEEEPKKGDFQGTSFEDLNQKIGEHLNKLGYSGNINEEYKNAKTSYGAMGTSTNKSYTVKWETGDQVHEAKIVLVEEAKTGKNVFYATLNVTATSKNVGGGSGGITTLPTKPTEMPSYSDSEDPILNPDFYEPTDTTGNNTQFINMGNVIIGIMRVVGTVIAVVSLMVIGLKYMFGSTAEKASYKETMIPYLIGAIMLFTIPNILGIIYDLVKGIKF